MTELYSLRRLEMRAMGATELLNTRFLLCLGLDHDSYNVSSPVISFSSGKSPGFPPSLLRKTNTARLATRLALDLYS
jgi:hypothetical protein